jgi:hypothetical protein
MGIGLFKPVTPPASAAPHEWRLQFHKLLTRGRDSLPRGGARQHPSMMAENVKDDEKIELPGL